MKTREELIREAEIMCLEYYDETRHRLPIYMPELLVKFAEAYHAQFEQPASIESIIESVAKHKYTAKGLNNAQKAWNDAFDVAVNEIKYTPCIRAKALRKKGTNAWYWFTGKYWMTSIYPNLTFTDSDAMDENELPDDAELINIEILVP